MTCRHGEGDPSTKNPEAMQAKAQAMMDKWGANTTPDAKNFVILDYHVSGSNVILKVQYPSCQACAYEGVKVLVFQDVLLLDILRWREIDPHFRANTKDRTPQQAPSPIARFPGTDEGWKHAIRCI